MDGVFTVMALAVTGAGAALVLYDHEKPFSLLVTIAAAALICLMCLPMAAEIAEFAEYLWGLSEQSAEILGTVLRVTAIGIITKISSDVCRDAEELAIGSAAELAGAVAALYVSLPLMRAVMEMVTELL